MNFPLYSLHVRHSGDEKKISSKHLWTLINTNKKKKKIKLGQNITEPPYYRKSIFSKLIPSGWEKHFFFIYKYIADKGVQGKCGMVTFFSSILSFRLR